MFTIDGRSVYFCSSKCKRNLDLKRDPKKVNWVKKEKKVKDGQVVEKKVDSKKEEKVEVKEENVEKKEDIKKEKRIEEEVDDDDE